MIVVNTLITIICDAFTSVRFDPLTIKLNKENEEIKQCFKDKILGFFGLGETENEEIIRDKNGKKIRQKAPDYLSPADMFPKTIDRLTIFVDDVSIPILLRYFIIKLNL